MKTIKNLVPAGISNHLFQEGGGIIISSLNYINEDLILTFNIFLDNVNKQEWQLTIEGIIAENFVRSPVKNLTFYSDHSLLYEFTDVFTDLYYNGKSKNPEKLLIDLYKSYLKNYLIYFPFTYGINEAMSVFKLCKDSSGMFARGSKKILTTYQECLAKHGIASNFVGETASKHTDLKLLAFGESNFIGKAFSFNKIADY